MTFIIKQANLDEITQSFANVHPVWPHDNDKAKHTALRLQSAKHRKGDIFVVLDKGIVVSSLARYPIELHLPKNPKIVRFLA